MKSEEEGPLGKEDIRKNLELDKVQGETGDSEVSLSGTQDLWLRVIRNKAIMTFYPCSSSTEDQRNHNKYFLEYTWLSSFSLSAVIPPSIPSFPSIPYSLYIVISNVN